VNKACGAFITTMEPWRHIYAAQLFQAFAAVLNFFFGALTESMRCFSLGGYAAFSFLKPSRLHMTRVGPFAIFLLAFRLVSAQLYCEVHPNQS